MSPTLFAGLVAGAILVAVFGVALIAMLVVRERGESRLRSRLAPEVDAAADFEDRHPRPMVASMVRGGKAIEGLVDAEGESGRLLMRAAAVIIKLPASAIAPPAAAEFSRVIM